MDVPESKSSTSGRQRPDYNGAVTALTAGEWADLARRRTAPVCLLIWTVRPGYEHRSDLLSRGEALRQFDGLAFIRGACHPHGLRRLRVVAETERLDALRRLAEAALVAL